MFKLKAKKIITFLLPKKFAYLDLWLHTQSIEVAEEYNQILVFYYHWIVEYACLKNDVTHMNV